MEMDQQEIRDYVASTYDGVDIQIASQADGAPEIAWGDTFFIYDPERTFEGTRRFPFATITLKPPLTEAYNIAVRRAKR